MRVRNLSVLAVAAVAVSLALTGCESGGGDGSSVSSGESCTDRIDYAGDPRSNAEINSIGEETGECPEPETADADADTDADAGIPAEPGVSCTDQIDYAGDPRSNAEINSIGEETGECPPVQGR